MAYRDGSSPMAKAVALLRNQFGGHPLHGTDGVQLARRAVGTRGPSGR